MRASVTKPVVTTIGLLEAQCSEIGLEVHQKGKYQRQRKRKWMERKNVPGRLMDHTMYWASTCDIHLYLCPGRLVYRLSAKYLQALKILEADQRSRWSNPREGGE